eukprot:GHVU01225655.1.p1 GENE.GHVU01225655.1~~GHVU01225655.1.p1  ORF type:complete len:291 (+),score=23.01 GHVU01225655.1:81-875(+)
MTKNDVVPAKHFNLPVALGVDAFSATVAAAAVSPFITVIDRSIVKNTAGAQKLSHAVKEGFITLAKNPFKFAVSRDYRIVCGVYAATYIAANSTSSICEWYGRKPEFPKFVATTVANITTCVRKDMLFAKMFGLKAATSAFPMSSYGLFLARDCLTIYAAFNLPPLLAKELRDRTNMGDSASENASQLILPASVQFISIWLHLLALDIYNRPDATKLQRWILLRREVIPSVTARICRILPAFGIGGVLNRVFRNDLRKRMGLPL